jgi:hypothetical protein
LCINFRVVKTGNSAIGPAHNLGMSDTPYIMMLHSNMMIMHATHVYSSPRGRLHLSGLHKHPHPPSYVRCAALTHLVSPHAASTQPSVRLKHFPVHLPARRPLPTSRSCSGCISSMQPSCKTHSARCTQSCRMNTMQHVRAPDRQQRVHVKPNAGLVCVVQCYCTVCRTACVCTKQLYV